MPALRNKRAVRRTVAITVVGLWMLAVGPGTGSARIVGGPVSTPITQPSFVASPGEGPVGALVSISGASPCVKPAGAVDWVAIVRFGQGANGEVSFRDYPVDANGDWSGSFTVPYGVVPGAAVLSAACFDASRLDGVRPEYQPVAFTVTPPTFAAGPVSGPVGTTIAIVAPTSCVKPAGAGDWVAIVRFGQGANGEVSFRDYPVDANGDWSGSFTVPYGVVPGAAVLSAACFDPSRLDGIKLEYQPVDFTVKQPSFVASPGEGPVGALVSISGASPCVKPAGAVDWVAIVRFGQGANGEVSFRDYPVDANGDWSGSFTVPYGVVPGAAVLSAACFDASRLDGVRPEYQPVAFTVTPPTFAAGPVSGPVGTTIAIVAPTSCVKPAGAGDWVAIVRFGQGANGEVSFRDYPVDANGDWSGSFTVPYGVVPGAAVLSAACFDPSRLDGIKLEYQPVDFTVKQPSFVASPGEGPVGALVSISGASPCVKPAGAVDWVAIVRFGQGANGEVSFRDYPVDANGDWSGSFTVPYGVVPGAAVLSAACFDASRLDGVRPEYQPVAFTVTPPTFAAGPVSGPVGTTIAIVAPTSCVKPAGAGDWVAIVRFGQGANGEVSFRDYPVDANGDWSGSFTVPYGVVPGAAVLSAACFDPSRLDGIKLEYQPVDFTVTADTTPPVIVPTLLGTLGNNGWYTGNISVAWSATDAESPISSSAGCNPSTVTTDTSPSGLGLSCTATSTGGTTTKNVTVKRDGAVPTVTYSGNAGAYAVDKIVAISCTAADPTPGSGLSATTCLSITGPAYTFGVGSHRFSANATDNAGNTGASSTGFSVTVTPTSLGTLTAQFIQSSPKYLALTATQKAVANQIVTGLSQRLAMIIPKLTPNQKAALVTVYQQAVAALIPAGWLTATQAQTLRDLARSL